MKLMLLNNHINYSQQILPFLPRYYAKHITQSALRKMRNAKYVIKFFKSKHHLNFKLLEVLM